MKCDKRWSFLRLVLFCFLSICLATGVWAMRNEEEDDGQASKIVETPSLNTSSNQQTGEETSPSRSWVAGGDNALPLPDEVFTLILHELASEEEGVSTLAELCFVCKSMKHLIENDGYLCDVIGIRKLEDESEIPDSKKDVFLEKLDSGDIQKAGGIFAHIDLLPDELKLHILFQISTHLQTLGRVCQVSRDWHDLVIEEVELSTPIRESRVQELIDWLKAHKRPVKTSILLEIHQALLEVFGKNPLRKLPPNSKLQGLVEQFYALMLKKTPEITEKFDGKAMRAALSSGQEYKSDYAGWEVIMKIACSPLLQKSNYKALVPYVKQSFELYYKRYIMPCARVHVNAVVAVILGVGCHIPAEFLEEVWQTSEGHKSWFIIGSDVAFAPKVTLLVALLQNKKIPFCALEQRLNTALQNNQCTIHDLAPSIAKSNGLTSEWVQKLLELVEELFTDNDPLLHKKASEILKNLLMNSSLEQSQVTEIYDVTEKYFKGSSSKDRVEFFCLPLACNPNASASDLYRLMVELAPIIETELSLQSQEGHMLNYALLRALTFLASHPHAPKELQRLALERAFLVAVPEHLYRTQMDLLESLCLANSELFTTVLRAQKEVLKLQVAGLNTESPAERWSNRIKIAILNREIERSLEVGKALGRSLDKGLDLIHGMFEALKKTEKAVEGLLNHAVEFWQQFDKVPSSSATSSTSSAESSNRSTSLNRVRDRTDMGQILLSNANSG